MTIMCGSQRSLNIVLASFLLYLKVRIYLVSALFENNKYFHRICFTSSNFYFLLFVRVTSPSSICSFRVSLKKWDAS